MRLRFKLLAAFAVFALPYAYSQTTGTMQGTITDSSGSVVPGAKITAKLEGGAVTRSATSDARGEFVLPTMAVGQYTVEVEAPGFSSCSRTWK